jgi:uncharacterized phage protein gp47/JayE
MIDPGHPFSAAYADVIAAVEDRLRHGTEQPARWRLLFQKAVNAYELPQEATGITSVAGTVGGVYTVFDSASGAGSGAGDYRLGDNRLIWVDDGRRPTDLTRVDVEYTFRERRSGLTDFNEGSVAGTLVRAVAREMTTIYEQMDQAYRRAFIDGASGVALDSVVALVGVVRIPTIKATGAVTYSRQTAAGDEVEIPARSRVADRQGRTFLSVADASIPPWREEFATQTGGVVQTVDRIAAVTGTASGTVLGVWAAATATTFDPGKPPPLGLVANPAKPFGGDERTIALAPPTGGAALPNEVRIRYSPKSVTVGVEAAVAGPESNVPAATVIVMPTPPTGISGVSNEAPIDGGRVAETDDRLRERAKHALERAGNATIGALRFAVLGIEGVDEVQVVDFAADSTLPPGEVRLRISASHPDVVRGAVERVVDVTRAAGVRVSIDVIETVLVTGRFVLVPDVDGAPGAKDQFIEAVIAAVLALPVGAPLQVRRLNALAFGIGGLADVVEAQLTTVGGVPAPDPLVVDPGRVVRPDQAHLGTMLLERLEATVKTPGTPEITVRLLDAAGTAMAAQRVVGLDVSVEISARLKTSATRAPEIVGTFAGRVTFDRSTEATLKVTAANAPNFRPDDHDPTVTVKIAASAYPGLLPATTLLGLR